MSGVPVDLEAEVAVLGGVLVSPGLIDQVLAETALQPGHFYLDRHRAVFGAILELHQEGIPLDQISVCDRLGSRIAEAGGRDYVASLGVRVAAPGNAAHHAKGIVHLAELRQIDTAAKRISQSISEGDDVAIADARAMLDEHMVAPMRSDRAPDALAELAYETAEGGRARGYPWPFGRLQHLSRGMGIRKGELVVVAGYTHHGKTAFTHQVLDSVAKAGARTWLYANEMDVEQHLGGILQRVGNVPYDEFIRGELSAEGRERMLKTINGGGIRWGITPCAGWTPIEVCAHIRLRRPDVCAIDILHNFPYEDERDLSRMVAAFVETAKVASTAIVLVCHLNRNRINSGTRPRPTLGDLRGTGDIENKADVVCFVHREQHPTTHAPLPESWVYFEKYRGGRLGGLGSDQHPLTFNEQRIRFEPVEPTMLDRQLAKAA